MNFLNSSLFDSCTILDSLKGAIVDALTDVYRKVLINDKVYYEYYSTHYEAFSNKYGEVLYEVVGER